MDRFIPHKLFTSISEGVISLTRFMPQRLWALMTALFVLHVLLIYKVTLIFSDSHFWLIKLYIILSGLFLLSRFFIVIFYTDAHTKDFSSSEYPSVSFIISAKNEEDSIYKTIATCMDVNYRGSLECISIDDGSTDGTRREMLRAKSDFDGKRGDVTFIGFDKNRGKREAMAEGLRRAKGSVVVFIDSDSFLEKDSVTHIVEHFLSDPRVGAVAGNTEVYNVNWNTLTKMQSARYGISFDIFKACESVFGTVTCCPGCFSAYRKDAVLRVLDTWLTQTFFGTRGTYGDDRSLTNLILQNFRVEYCRKALVYTIVPDRYKKFFKQQLRWKKSWIREGGRAAGFFWKKNPIAALSFYINFSLPIFAPFVVINAFFVQLFIFSHLPVVFLVGILSLGFLFGLFYFWISGNRYWWYTVPFTLMYTCLLIWQMPYALITITDTRWGTR